MVAAEFALIARVRSTARHQPLLAPRLMMHAVAEMQSTKIDVQPAMMRVMMMEVPVMAMALEVEMPVIVMAAVMGLPVRHKEPKGMGSVSLPMLPMMPMMPMMPMVTMVPMVPMVTPPTGFGWRGDQAQSDHQHCNCEKAFHRFSL